ncbi:hypothetical protein [Woeseia oceani]|nr:hypothetical protein [Woeseia oceani]
MNTALKLKSELEDIADYISEGLLSQYFKIGGKSDLISAVEQITNYAETHGLKPWLHFEGHGAQDESGLVLADGEYVSWDEFREIIVPLNVATDLNLILVFATCFGGSFARSMRTTERAPVLALIGPTSELSAGDVQTDFCAFYRTFFETGSLGEANDALNRRVGSGLYYRVTAESFFYEVWISYKQKMCDEYALRTRAKSIRNRMKSETNERVPGVSSIVRTLRREEPRQFCLFRDTYFMYDINNSNRSRFPVTYEEAERRVVSR